MLISISPDPKHKSNKYFKILAADLKEIYLILYLKELKQFRVPF